MQPNLERGDLRISVSFGTLIVDAMAENVSYSPDVMNDMLTQASKQLTTLINEIRSQHPSLFVEYEPVVYEDEDEEEDADETND